HVQSVQLAGLQGEVCGFKGDGAVRRRVPVLGVDGGCAAHDGWLWRHQERKPGSLGAKTILGCNNCLIYVIRLGRKRTGADDSASGIGEEGLVELVPTDGPPERDAQAEPPCGVSVRHSGVDVEVRYSCECSYDNQAEQYEGQLSAR